MPTIHCHIIEDLLPLYIDDACSQESRTLIEEHLAACSRCRSLYTEMTASLPDSSFSKELDAKQALGRLRRAIALIAVTAALMAACFAANVGGAWMGDPAKPWNLIVTVIYCLFWAAFTLLSRNSRSLSRAAFLISLLTFISSANSLVWRLLGSGGFITAFVSVFASVPFYGLRFFMDWTALYVVATHLSLLWLICAGVWLRKTKAHIP